MHVFEYTFFRICHYVLEKRVLEASSYTFMTPPLERRFASSVMDLSDLCRSMDLLENAAFMESFLRDLCTPQELTMLSERWAIAKLMHMGFSYRIISQKTGASSATIARVSQSLSKGTGELMRACRLREEALARLYEAPQE